MNGTKSNDKRINFLDLSYIQRFWQRLVFSKEVPSSHTTHCMSFVFNDRDPYICRNDVLCV